MEGVNSSLDPKSIRPLQYAWGINVDNNRGVISPRPGNTELFRLPNGKPQMLGHLKTRAGEDYVVAAVSGKLYSSVYPFTSWTDMGVQLDETVDYIHSCQVTQSSCRVLCWELDQVQEEFNQPEVSEDVQVTVLSTVAWAQPGATVWIDGPNSYYTIKSVDDEAHLTLTNMGGFGSAAAGTEVAVGSHIKSSKADRTGERAMIAPRNFLIISDAVNDAVIFDGTHVGRSKRGEYGIPLCSWMTFTKDRLWVYDVENKSIKFSDITNPLCFYDVGFLAMGGSYSTDTPCTGIHKMPDERGSVLVFEKDKTWILMAESPIQRSEEEWKRMPRFKQQLLPHIGCLSGRSFVSHYGDLWWQSNRGLMSLKHAMQSVYQDSMPPLDLEMTRSRKEFGTPGEEVVGTSHGNYFLMSMPNGEIWAKNNTPGAMLGQTPPPTWVGVWTGLKAVQFTTFVENSTKKETTLCLSKDTDNHNRVWRMFNGTRRDNGGKIKWSFESRVHEFGNIFFDKRMKYFDLKFSEVFGDVDLRGYYKGMRGGWKQLLSKGIKAAESLDSNGNPIYQVRSVRSQEVNFSNLTGPGTEGSQQADPIDGAFQIMIQGEGEASLVSYQIVAQLETPNVIGRMESDEGTSQSVVADGDPEKMPYTPTFLSTWAPPATGNFPLPLQTCYCFVRSDVEQPQPTEYTSTKTVTVGCPVGFGAPQTATATETSLISQQDADDKAEAAATEAATALLVCTYTSTKTVTLSCPTGTSGDSSTATMTATSMISQADADALATDMATAAAQAGLRCHDTGDGFIVVAGSAGMLSNAYIEGTDAQVTTNFARINGAGNIDPTWSAMAGAQRLPTNGGAYTAGNPINGDINALVAFGSSDSSGQYAFVAGNFDAYNFASDGMSIPTMGEFLMAGNVGYTVNTDSISITMGGHEYCVDFGSLAEIELAMQAEYRVYNNAPQATIHVTAGTGVSVDGAGTILSMGEGGTLNVSVDMGQPQGYTIQAGAKIVNPDGFNSLGLPNVTAVTGLTINNIQYKLRLLSNDANLQVTMFPSEDVRCFNLARVGPNGAVLPFNGGTSTKVADTGAPTDYQTDGAILAASYYDGGAVGDHLVIAGNFSKWNGSDYSVAPADAKYSISMGNIGSAGAIPATVAYPNGGTFLAWVPNLSSISTGVLDWNTEPINSSPGLNGYTTRLVAASNQDSSTRNPGGVLIGAGVNGYGIIATKDSATLGSNGLPIYSAGDLLGAPNVAGGYQSYFGMNSAISLVCGRLVAGDFTNYCNATFASAPVTQTFPLKQSTEVVTGDFYTGNGSRVTTTYQSATTMTAYPNGMVVITAPSFRVVTEQISTNNNAYPGLEGSSDNTYWFGPQSTTGEERGTWSRRVQFNRYYTSPTTLVTETITTESYLGQTFASKPFVIAKSRPYISTPYKYTPAYTAGVGSTPYGSIPFNTQSRSYGPNGRVLAMAKINQPSYYYIGGEFTNWEDINSVGGGATYPNLVRLDAASLYLDTTFQPAVTGDCTAIMIYGNSKIVAAIGGKLVRFNSNGSADTSWVQTNALGTVRRMHRIGSVSSSDSIFNNTIIVVCDTRLYLVADGKTGYTDGQVVAESVGSVSNTPCGATTMGSSTTWVKEPGMF